MNGPLDEVHQDLAMNAICFAAQQVTELMRGAIWESMERPSVVRKPVLSRDGDHWCALFGDDIQSGVAGFGKSPALAMRDFDRAWECPIPNPTETLPIETPNAGVEEDAK